MHIKQIDLDNEMKQKYDSNNKQVRRVIYRLLGPA